MRFRIHFEHPDGGEDSFVVSGETIAEIQRKSDAELDRTGGINPWSEEIT